MKYDYDEVCFIYKRQLQHDQIPRNYNFLDWMQSNVKEVKMDKNGRNYTFYEEPKVCCLM